MSGFFVHRDVKKWPLYISVWWPRCKGQFSPKFWYQNSPISVGLNWPQKQYHSGLARFGRIFGAKLQVLIIQQMISLSERVKHNVESKFWIFIISAIENVFRVCIAWYKHERGWENSTQLCKPETKSRVCMTVENSPNASSVYIRLCEHSKKVFYCFYKITFTRKKRKTLCMALIKRDILTSRKILSTKSCTRNQFLFCKKMLCKIRIFLA